MQGLHHGAEAAGHIRADIFIYIVWRIVPEVGPDPFLESQLFAAGTDPDHVVRDIAEPAAALLRQKVDAGMDPAALVADHALHVGQVQVAVHDKDRLAGHVLDNGFLDPGVLKHGSHQDQGIHRTLFHGPDTFRSALICIAGIEDQGAVPFAGQDPGDLPDTFRQVDGTDIRDQDADHAVALGDQASGRLVGNIVVLFEKLFDLLPGLGIHPGLIIDNSGYRAGGNTCFFGDVIDRHWLALHGLLHF